MFITKILHHPSFRSILDESDHQPPYKQYVVSFMQLQRSFQGNAFRFYEMSCSAVPEVARILNPRSRKDTTILFRRGLVRSLKLRKTGRVRSVWPAAIRTIANALGNSELIVIHLIFGRNITSTTSFTETCLEMSFPLTDLYF